MVQKIKGKCKFCGSEYAYYDSGAGFFVRKLHESASM